MYQENLNDSKAQSSSSTFADNTSSQTLVFQNNLDYHGICNLCFFDNHQTQDCPFAMTFYHATNKDSLPSILENGLKPGSGRLGKGVYVSDNPEMCIKYVSKRAKKFQNPILLKLKVMISGEIRQINNQEQARTFSLEFLQNEGIQAIKRPYFEFQDRTLFEYLLICPERVVIFSWSPIIESEQRDRPLQKNNGDNLFSKKKRKTEKYDKKSTWLFQDEADSKPIEDSEIKVIEKKKEIQRSPEMERLIQQNREWLMKQEKLLNKSSKKHF